MQIVGFNKYEETNVLETFQLDLPVNCTKVCVLIEHVLAAFEMEEILFELRHRAIGLNCGLLDYSASILKTFGKLSLPYENLPTQ